MIAEVEYIVRKKINVECNDFNDVLRALSEMNWVEEGRVLHRKPEIIQKIIIDDEIAEYNSRKEKLIMKKEKKENPFKNEKEWMEEWNKRTETNRKENLLWSYDKCKLIARQSMPDFPNEKRYNWEPEY